jgi:hypothetical protein
MFLEIHTGEHINANRKHFETMERSVLQEYLELRGYAVYDDEPTWLLVETAEEDYDNELS